MDMYFVCCNIMNINIKVWTLKLEKLEKYKFLKTVEVAAKNEYAE